MLKNGHLKLWPIISGIVLLCAAVGVTTYHILRPKSLLPVGLTRQTTAFVPYFYFGKIPAGYTIDNANSRSSGDTLLVSLKKLGEPTLVLSEQSLPRNLSHEQIFQNGERIESVSGTATINSVEGRLVGVYTPPGNDVLVLLNAPGNASKDDLKALILGLQAIRNP